MGRSCRQWGSVRSLRVVAIRPAASIRTRAELFRCHRPSQPNAGADRWLAAKWIEPRLGSMPVRRIKPSHVDDWVADMIERG